jgi:hypothetical protein
VEKTVNINVRLPDGSGYFTQFGGRRIVPRLYAIAALVPGDEPLNA